MKEINLELIILVQALALDLGFSIDEDFIKKVSFPMNHTIVQTQDGSFYTYTLQRGSWKHHLATCNLHEGDTIWTFTTLGRNYLFPYLSKALEYKNGVHVTKTLNIFCGDDHNGSGLSPLEECKAAKSTIQDLKHGREFSKDVVTNSLDYMRFAKQFCDKHKIEVVFHGKGLWNPTLEDIEKVFASDMDEFIKETM